MKVSLALLLIALAWQPALAVNLSPAALDKVGRKVWQNECGGTRDGLTSWNTGEDFASLGIGHFIWYPAGKRGPFDESWPKLVRFLEGQGVKVPPGLDGPCPWRTRAEFMADFRSERMNALRDLLANTVRQQSAWLSERLEEALPKMLDAAPAADRENVRRQYGRVKATAAGTFALIDYVNFKGEGIKASERYDGQGWGLLQVLQGMRGEGGGAVEEFSSSAVAVLTRRVQNAPKERNEGRWLPGWKNRVRAYVE